MKIMLYKLKNISPDIINVAGRLIHPKQEVKTATIEPYRIMLEKGLLKIISEEENGSPHNILFVHSKRKGEVFSKPFMKMNYEVNQELTERLNRQSAVHNNTSINNPNYIPNLSKYNNIIKIPETNTFMPIDIKSGISYFAPQTNITLSNEIKYVDNFTKNNINDDIFISAISTTNNISVSNSANINDICITTSNDTTSTTSSPDFISINTYDISVKDDYILFDSSYATNDSEVILFNDSSVIDKNILSTMDANITNIQSLNISDKSIYTIPDNIHQHNTDLLTADVINTNEFTVEDNLLTDVQNEPITISSITAIDNNPAIQHSNNLIQHFNQLQKEIHQQLNAPDTILHGNNKLDINTNNNNKNNNDNDYAINTNIANNANNIAKSVKSNDKNNEHNILMQLINNTKDDVNRLMQITANDTPAYQFIDTLIHEYSSNNNSDNIIADNSKSNMDLCNNSPVADNAVYTNSVNNNLISYNAANHMDTTANNQLEEIIMQKLDNLLEQKLNQNITTAVNQYLIPAKNKCNENTLSIDKTIINNIIQSLFKLFIDRQITDTDLDNIKQFYQRIHILDNIDKSILNQIQSAHSYEELITVLLNSVYPALLAADLQSSI